MNRSNILDRPLGGGSKGLAIRYVMMIVEARPLAQTRVSISLINPLVCMIFQWRIGWWSRFTKCICLFVFRACTISSRTSGFYIRTGTTTREFGLCRGSQSVGTLGLSSTRGKKCRNQWVNVVLVWITTDDSSFTPVTCYISVQTRNTHHEHFAVCLC